MPPLLEDEEISDYEVMEIPATKPMPVLVKQDAEQNDDEEEADEDDGYEVEEIIAHEKKGKNRLEFLIHWKGYDAEKDMTWEPEENLDAAQEILSEYLQKHGGREALLAGKKRKAQDSPQVKVEKDGRGNKKKAPDVSNSMVDEERMAGRFPPGSWENAIASIDYIEESTDPRSSQLVRYAYVHWSDGKDPVHTRHTLNTLYKKCPQRMLQYYEAHLVFRNNQVPSEIAEVASTVAASMDVNGKE